MGAADLFSPWGMLSDLASVRSDECETAVLTLQHVSQSQNKARRQQRNIQGEILLGGLARDELLPSLCTLTDNVHGVFFVLALAGKGELVLGLAVGDLVDAEPLVGSAQQAGQVALNVLNIVELGGQWVVDIDDHDLPVGLALVEQSHDTEDLDLDDLARLGN